MLTDRKPTSARGIFDVRRCARALARLLVLLGVVGLPAAWAQARPTDPATDASNVCGDLGAFYERIGSLPADSDLDALVALSRELLEGKQALLARTSGVRDLARACERIRLADVGTKNARWLRREGLRYCACAWLHAWSSLSQILSRMAPLWPGEKSLADIMANEGSPFLELVRIHAALVSMDPGGLQSILGDGDGLVLSLRYNHSWRESDVRGNVRHAYYVPSERALLGSPTDEPTIDRQLMTVWGMVYYCVDHLWEFAGGSVASQRPGEEATELVGSKALPAFLRAVGQNNSIKAFEAPVAGPSTTTDLAIGALALADFVEAKLKLLERGFADATVRRIRSLRKSNDVAGMRSALASLVAASSAKLPAGRAPALPCAQVLLRHLLLLSYDTDSDLVLRDTAGGLGSLWKDLGLPGSPLDILAEAGSSGSGSGIRLRRFSSLPTYEGVLWASDEHVLALLGVRSEGERLGLEGLTSRDDAEGLREMAPKLSRVDVQQKLTLTTPAREGVSPRALLASATAHALGATPEELRRWASSWQQSVAIRDALEVRRACEQEATWVRRAWEALSQPTPEEQRARIAPLVSPESPSFFQGIAIPQKTFKEYRRDLDLALAQLDAAKNGDAARKLLLSEFRSTRARAASVRLVLKAQELGCLAAERAGAVANALEQMSVLEARAEALGAQANALLLRASEKDRSAAEIGLSMAHRALQLADAELSALRQAATEVKALADLAAQELRGYADELVSQATQIRSEEQSNFVTSIVKAIINVIGAVLAPYTGGASVAISALVTRAIDIARSGNFDLATLGQIAGDVSKAAEVMKIEVPGVAKEDAQRVLGEVRNWVHAVDGQTRSLGVQAEAFLRSLRGSGVAEFQQVVACIANGLPIETSADGKVHLRPGLERLTLRAGPIADYLRRACDDGGVVAAGFEEQQRISDLLLSATPAELKTELARILRASLQPGLEERSAQIARTRDELVAHVVSNSSDVEVCRTVLIALASGATMVRIGDAPAFLTRPATAELEATSRHIAALAEAAYRNKLNAARDALGALRDDLVRKASELEKARNYVGLEALAREVSETYVPKALKQCEEIDRALLEAEEADRTARDSAALARYANEGTTLRTRAQGVLTSRDEVEKVIAERKIGAMRASSASAAYHLQSEAAMLKAAQAGVDAAEEDVDRIYSHCIAAGVSVRDAAFPPQIGDTTTLSLRGLAFGSDTPEGIASECAVRYAASSILGMSKWVRVLNVSTADGDAADLAMRTALRITRPGRDLNEVRRELDEAVRKLSNEYTSWVSKRMEVRVVGLSKLTNEEILWRGMSGRRLSTAQIRELLGRAGIDSAREPQVVGAVRVSILDRTPPPGSAEDTGRLKEIPIEGSRARYYVDARRMAVTLSGIENLYFLAIPPLLAGGHRESCYVTAFDYLGGDTAVSRPKKILQSLDESCALMASARDDYDKSGGTALVGGLGVWTFLIMSSEVTGVDPVEQATQRASIQRAMRDSAPRMDIHFVYLSVAR